MGNVACKDLCNNETEVKQIDSRNPRISALKLAAHGNETFGRLSVSHHNLMVGAYARLDEQRMFCG